jgi:phenylpyruvate tautomerase PptA (4-oxalocrotonate tautomerase family)
MKVEIYVEGTSDKYAMEALLSHLIEEKLQQGIRIEFFPVKGSNNDRGGNAKKDLLTKTPTKAVDIIRNNPTTIVVIMPDFYPQNVGFDHETVQELENGILDNFNQVLQSKRITDNRLIERFRVFCFKHDLEALILAAESQLISVLGVNSLTVTWTIPVEDQNHNVPPKNIVEGIFIRCGKKYKGTVDAPRILGSARYQDIAEQCPQAFGLFVEFLENI